MGTSIFASKPGSVGIIRADAGNQIALMAFIDPKEPPDPDVVIITGLDYRQMTNQQFMPSLRRAIFIYTFGDQMGNIQLRGTLIMNRCDNAENAQGKTGLEAIMDFYGEHRVAVRNTPIKFQIGTTAIKGYLTTLAIMNTNIMLNAHDFVMALRTLPVRKK